MKFIRPPEQDIFETKKKISTILKYSQEHPNFGLWTAWLEDHFIGWVILLHIEHNPEYPIEVGYRLHTKYWGQGYATEMAQALVDYAKEIHLDSVCGITIEENVGSMKVLEKCGLKYIEDRLYYEVPVRYYEIKL
jgi:RimJ/RimL family protein N-acetyltransferase